MEKSEMTRAGLLLPLSALAAIPVLAASQQPTPLKPAEKIAIWKAAGFSMRGGKILDGCDQPKQPPIERRDLNGDGMAEAVVTDDGMCYGMTGAYFAILTPDGVGKWRSIINLIGIPNIMKTRAKGWPDIEVGGPGSAFRCGGTMARSTTINAMNMKGRLASLLPEGSHSP